MLGGTFGRYLRVDLDIPRADPVELDDAVTAAVLGGVGLGTLLVLRETSPGFDPLGPEAALVLAFGPLTGTALTTSAKLAIVAKSPLTGRLNDAITSSDLAVEGKRTGFDAVVLRGALDSPGVVLVDDGRLEIVPCPELWDHDLSVSDVTAALEARHPGYAFTVIGTAGERLVRFAGLANGGRHAGRGGLGAVLGSKRVKAVGLRGSARAAAARPVDVATIARELAARSLGPATEKYRVLGTVANLATLNRLAALPTQNFRSSTFEGAAALSGESLMPTRERARGSCRSCTIGCEHFFEVERGAPPVKAEYENVFALGPLCGVRDPAIVLAASRACDELGIDTISAGGTIAFAMDCAELGLFRGTPFEREAEGLGFGDGARLLELLESIARRRGPLADLLADGSRRAAERLGGRAVDIAPHVKGLEIPGYEPRALQTMALGFAVSTRGADHNRSGAYEVDLSGKVDRFDPGPGAARLAVETEDRAAVLDSLVLCKFLRGALVDLFAETAAMLSAVTGRPFDADEVREIARRIVLLRRVFNAREGWTPLEDTLPARFFEEALPDGAARGARLSREGLERMKEAYHAERGLSRDGTMPVDMTRAAGIDALV